jgi:hypothetical protein
MRAITADIVPGPTRILRALQVRVGHQSQDREDAWADGAPTLLAIADEVIE